MRSKKKNRIYLLLILLLAVTIGFALLTQKLNIDGVSNILASKWDIHWDNVANEDGITPSTAAYIKDSEKQIVEFQINFTEPGEYYEFTVDAVNEGTLDGEIAKIDSKINGKEISTLPNYIKYSITYGDGSEVKKGDILAKKSGNTPTRKTYKIRVEFDADLFTNDDMETMPDEGVDYVFEFNFIYKQGGVNDAVAFATDDWDVIAAEGTEAAKQTSITNNKCGAYNLGDTKEISMDIDGDGVIKTYRLRIANCSTPAVCNTEGYSQTACGFVLEFEDIIKMRRFTYQYRSYDQINGYPTTDLYNDYLKDDATYWIYNRLPEELKNKIIETTAVSSHGCGESRWVVVDGYGHNECTPLNNDENHVTTDKLYLFSTKEIWGKDSENNVVYWDNAEDETRQLDYYKAKGVSTEPNNEVTTSPELKKYNGTYTPYWLRTTLNSSYNFFGAVNVSSGRWTYTGSNSLYGVSPAFRIG